MLMEAGEGKNAGRLGNGLAPAAVVDVGRN